MLIADFLGIGEFIQGLLLKLTGLIYDAISWIYDIFLALAKTNIFKESDYKEIVDRIYIILGVFTLYILAYSLLTAVINPDKAEKSEFSAPNLIKKILTSLIIIVLLPTAFKYIFNVQNVILNQGIISRLILGGNSNYKRDVNNGGNNIAYYTYQAFFQPDADWCKQSGFNSKNCDKYVKSETSTSYQKIYNGMPLRELNAIMSNGENEERMSFKSYSAFAKNVQKDEISFNFLFSLLTGIVVFILLLIYCVDLGIRVFKLAFFQLIAPITVMCRVIPKQEKIFNSWLKSLLLTITDVFVKIGIMCFGVYAIQKLIDYFGEITTIETTTGRNLSFFQMNLMKGFLIVGIVLFIKQAPKLLKDIFGFEGTGGFLDTVKDTMRIGRTALGAGVGLHAGVHNLTNGLKGITNQKPKMAVKQAKTALKSGIGGLGSGAVRGIAAGAKSKSWKDFKNGKEEAFKKTEEKRKKRSLYKAQHGNMATGVAMGHIADRGRAISAWAGVGDTIADLDKDNAVIQNITGAEKELKDMTFSSMDSVLSSGSSKYDIDKYYSVSNLKQLHAALLAAQHQGDAKSIGIAQAEYDNFRKEWSEKMLKKVLANKATIDEMSQEQKTAFKDMIVAAYKVRGAWQDGLDKDYIKSAGLTSADFADDKDLSDLFEKSKDPRNPTKFDKARQNAGTQETENSIKKEQLRNTVKQEGKDK